MKKISYFFLVIMLVGCEQKIDSSKDIEEITGALHISAEKWSAGDLEGYMDVYWRSEELQFIGKNGIIYGWNQTLENYKKGYPNKDDTGQLKFKILNVSFLAKDLYALTGEYHLIRNKGNADGIYTLIFKKVNNKWVIISDHSQ